MRVVRVIVGTLLVIVALPMLVTGGALWGAMQHRGADGAFTAQVSELSTGGYAIVALDLDRLLRREASFTRAGQTTLRIGGTADQRLFVGIAPTSDVQRYLAGLACGGRRSSWRRDPGQPRPVRGDAAPRPGRRRYRPPVISVAPATGAGDTPVTGGD